MYAFASQLVNVVGCLWSSVSVTSWLPSSCYITRRQHKSSSNKVGFILVHNDNVVELAADTDNISLCIFAVRKSAQLYLPCV